MTSGRSFAVATAVADMGGGVYHGAVAEGWDIRGNANGGYLLAVAGRAMAHAAERPDPVSVTGHYLTPGRPGPADVVAHVVKRGKRLATVAATLSANGRPVVAALGTFGDLSVPQESPALVEGAPPELPPPEECVRRADTADHVQFSHRLDMRLHPDDARLREDDRSGRPLIRGWFRLHDDEQVDTLALLCVVDAFPPTAFNAHLPAGWTPTVELTAHVRARPVPGWLRCRFETRFVTGGFIEEDGEVWDAAGTLVAQSRQLALLANA